MMNNPDNRQTSATYTGDTKPDSADVLSLIQVIERLYEAGRSVINRHSATAVLMAMAVELQTLLVKLQAMHRRWEVHLPFKEASTVDFSLWSNKVAQMAAAMRGGDCRNCMDVGSDIPSCHCLADLYDLAQSQTAETATNTIEADAKQMLIRRSTLQDALRGQRDLCVEAITQMVTLQLSVKHTLDLSPLTDLQTCRTVCASLLTELSELLEQIHLQQVKFISDQEYDRLAARILLEAEYDGPKARREAREMVVNWRNGVPVKSLDHERQQQIEQVKEEIRKTKHGVKFEQYVDLDKELLSQRSEFGRFLFKRRCEISRSELRELIRLVYAIYYYRQDARQPIGQTNPAADPIDLPTVNSDRQTSDILHQISDCPTLPTDFSQKLRDSQAATMCFYRILIKAEPFINSGKPEGCSEDDLAHYKDWTWCYMQMAFEKLGFLPKGSSKAPFADFIHQLFPRRKKESVERSLHRNTNPNSPNIVADIVKEFSPVNSFL